jgi:hypothetical protein
MIELLMVMDVLTADFDLDEWLKEGMTKDHYQRLEDMGIMPQDAFNKANKRLSLSDGMQELQGRKPTNRAALKAWAK